MFHFETRICLPGKILFRIRARPVFVGCEATSPPHALRKTAFNSPRLRCLPAKQLFGLRTLMDGQLPGTTKPMPQNNISRHLQCPRRSVSVTQPDYFPEPTSESLQRFLRLAAYYSNL